MKLDLIFAITENNLFGIDNRLPWIQCKDDLKFFNRITTDPFYKNYCVMGRKTWESLPNKLPDRINVVIQSKIDSVADISKDETEFKQSDLKYDSLESFVDTMMKKDTISEKIFIIGGKSLIEETLTKYKNIVDNVYISIIKKEIVEGKDKIYLDINLKDFLPFLENKVELQEVVFYHFKLPEHQEIQYLDLLRKTLKGDNRSTRNADTISIFSEKLCFDLTKGFPLLTTKKVFFRGIFEELMFFIRGQTNSKILEEKGVNIWKWNTTKEFIQKCGLEYEEGDMGPLYGFNWKHFGADYISCKTDYTSKGFNQLEEVLNLLEKDPHSRRILLTDYNPSIAKKGVLYPCHSIIIQFYVCSSAEGRSPDKVEEKMMVSMNMYQRSVDEFLGLPFNIASNALFLHLICNTLNQRNSGREYFPDKLNIIMGDCHIYHSHLEAVREQISRIPYDLPQIIIKRRDSCLENYQWEDIEIKDYKSHSTIKADMVA